MREGPLGPCRGWSCRNASRAYSRSCTGFASSAMSAHTDASAMTQQPPFVKIADDVKLGRNVRFAGFANLYGCEIGDDCMVGPFVEIQRGVVVGNRVKIQSHSFLCSGVTVHDEAFIGHGVMFINDRLPRSTTDDGQIK